MWLVKIIYARKDWSKWFLRLVECNLGTLSLRHPFCFHCIALRRIEWFSQIMPLHYYFKILQNLFIKNLFFLSALQFNCRHFLEAGNKKLGQRRSHDAWGLDQVLEISGTESGIRLSEEIVLQPDARVQVSDLQRYQYQIRLQDLSGKILDILMIDISLRLVLKKSYTFVTAVP